MNDTFFKMFLKNFWADKMAVAGGLAVAILFIISIGAPFIAPHDPRQTGQIKTAQRLNPPSSQHLMGTDTLGRDVFTRLVWGSRVSLKVGFAAVGLASAIGLLLGALAGYYGGWIDHIIMRFCDLMLCFPTMFLILAVIAILEPSIWNVMVVIGLTSWMGVARFVRAEFLTLKNRDFVTAAVAMGASDFRIIMRHLIPNALTPVLVSATLGVAGAILTESALSFLGLGVSPPTPSWGSMLSEGKDYLAQAWWLSVYPGLAILLTVLSYNLLGEGLRRALDPRQY